MLSRSPIPSEFSFLQDEEWLNYTCRHINTAADLDEKTRRDQLVPFLSQLPTARLASQQCSRSLHSLSNYRFPVKDALAVETHVNVVRDACLRHAGRGGGAGQEGGGSDGGGDGDVHDHGLTAAQFQAACADLAKEDDFMEFRKLADSEGLSSAVYSRLLLCLSVKFPVSYTHLTLPTILLV